MRRILQLWLSLSVVLLNTVTAGANPQKFKFGHWPYGLLAEPGNGYLISQWTDTLHFNFIIGGNEPATVLNDCLAKNLKVVEDNVVNPLNETYWPFYYSASHYTAWQAEGNPGYNERLIFTGGDEVQDGAIRAHRFRPGVDPAGSVQVGPAYTQEVVFRGVPRDSLGEFPKVEYTAEFHLRTDLIDTAHQPVAILQVQIGIFVCTDSTGGRCNSARYADSVVAIDTVFGNEIDTSYLPFTLIYRPRQYTIDKDAVYNVQFKVNWFGTKSLYLDKIVVYDQVGKDLIVNHFGDADILNYVDTHNDAHPAVAGWYLAEEIQYPDLLQPWKDVDSLLRVSGKKRGYAVNNATDFQAVVQPKEVAIDLYPLFGGFSTATDTAPPASLQNAWNLYLYGDLYAVPHLGLDSLSRIAKQTNREFHVTAQAFSFDTLNRGPGGGWYPWWRKPTNSELRCMTNLALAHGAKGVLYFKWAGASGYDLFGGTDNGRNEGILTETGQRTALWYAIRDTIGPFIEKIGDLLYDLTWAGAVLSENVQQIPGNFISSVTSQEFPTNPYIEVGYFQPPICYDCPPEIGYFMLVNRRCLPSETQTLTVDFGGVTMSNGVFEVVNEFTNERAVIGTMNGKTRMRVSLAPGEAKLFHVFPYGGNCLGQPCGPQAAHGSNITQIWGDVQADGDITVDPGKTLNVYPPSIVRFKPHADTLATGIDPQKNELIVNGNLIAQGSGTDSIIFTSISSPQSDSAWRGIRVLSSGRSKLKLAQVKHAYNALEFAHNKPDTVSQCLLDSNYNSGVTTSGLPAPVTGDSLVVTLCTIRNNFAGFGIKAAYSSPTISGNTFADCLYDVYLYKSASWVSGNSFTHTRPGLTGVYLNSAKVINVKQDTIPAVISGCRFTGPFANHIYAGAGAAATIGACTFDGPSLGVNTSLYSFGGGRVKLRNSSSVNFDTRNPCPQIPECHGAAVIVSYTSGLDLGNDAANSPGGNSIYEAPHGNNPPGHSTYIWNMSTTTLKAEGNWWGTTTPDSTHNFMGPVDFRPFCDDSTCLPPEEPMSKPLAGGVSLGFQFGLEQNEPNPFNPLTRIRFTLPEPGQVTLKVYNLIGQQVATLVNEYRDAGSHEVIWNGKDREGKPVASGVYFYTVTAGEHRATRRMVVLK